MGCRKGPVDFHVESLHFSARFIHVLPNYYAVSALTLGGVPGGGGFSGLGVGVSTT